MSIKVTVIGHLTRNPEQRNTQNGGQYVSVSVAGNEGYGQRQETFYFSGDIYGKRGQSVLGYQKGDLVCLSGHLHEYQGQNGQVYKALKYAEIEFLRHTHSQQSQGQYPPQYQQAPQPQYQPPQPQGQQYQQQPQQAPQGQQPASQYNQPAPQQSAPQQAPHEQHQPASSPEPEQLDLAPDGIDDDDLPF